MLSNLKDPWQLNNLNTTDLDEEYSDLFKTLRMSLNKFAKCSGKECRELRTS